MPHNIDLILTFTGGLAAALVLGYVTERLKMSPIVGYLLAGIAVGPFTPGFVANDAIAAQFAELGVILLMFGVGLHFDIDDLFAVRKVAIPGAIVQSAVATVLGVVVTWGFGWSLQAGLVFGVGISVASTVVLLRVLADNNELHTHAGHVAVGWLIVEDIFTVIALVILPLVVGAESREAAGGGGVLWSLGKALVEIAFLCVFTIVAGRRLLPRLLAHMAKSQSRELFTLSVLVIALGIAVGAAKLFGASMALGAFLAGMVVGQSDFSARAAAEALPLRDAFAVLFFVAMGMLFDPMQMLEHLPLTLATLAVIMIGKPLAALAVTRMLHQPVRTSIAVSVALAQVGEFSFMVASLGLSLGVLPPEATQALVAASIISITLNPALFKLVDPLSKRLARRPMQVTEPLAPAAEGHIIVVGYGAVGRQIVSLLLEYNLTPTVIDLNAETVHHLRSEGIRAVYGDASMREILQAADIHHARALIFSSNAPTFETVRTALELNENIAVLTRTAYLRDAEALRRVGASVVVSEVEVALAMTENILMRLGATAEQLDRARERVRGEFGGPNEQGAIRELRSIHEPA